MTPKMREFVDFTSYEGAIFKRILEQRIEGYRGQLESNTAPDVTAMNRGAIIALRGLLLQAPEHISVPRFDNVAEARKQRGIDG